MNSTSFNYSDRSAAARDLEAKVVQLVGAHNFDAADGLKREIASHEDEKRLKIAFVGQHNSGKSSIISALTGNRAIKISNNVETDVPTDYSWNDVYLTDTPGLYAGKKEEHDKLSLQKIKESDLLVFCITSSLFDDLLLSNFADIAYRQGLKSKIFLVINKMSLEDGDFDTLRENYEITLKKTLGQIGGDYNDFPAIFMDAHDYIEGVDEDDEELIEISHFPSFVNALNAYIKERGMIGRLDAPCRIMLGTIDQEIANTGTELDKNMLAVLRQAESKISHRKSECFQSCHDEIESLRSDIMGKAHELISKIGEEKIDEKSCEAIYGDIESFAAKRQSEINDMLTEKMQLLQKEVADVLSSEQAQFVMNELNVQKFEINMDVAKDFSSFHDKFVSGSEKVSSVAGELAKRAGDLGKGISGSSGSQLHSIVLKVGHFFGKTFKPWQAVKTASKIGRFAKVLGPALSVIGGALDIATVVHDDRMAKKISQTRQEAFNTLSSIASDLCNQILKQYKDFGKDAFDSKLKEVEHIRAQMVATNNSNVEYVGELKALRQEIEDFRATLV